MSLRMDSEAILLRIYIGESDTYEGKPLCRYIVEYLKKEGISGATELRGVMGFGQTSRISSSSILLYQPIFP